jgi:hypothetical protein
MKIVTAIEEVDETISSFLMKKKSWKFSAVINETFRNQQQNYFRSKIPTKNMKQLIQNFEMFHF